jgi:hypothetical protein
MGTFERSIQNRSAEAIARHYPKAYVRVHHGTQFGKVGEPDIDGCVAGRFFAFEVKNERGELTKIQRYRLQEIARAGGIQGGIKDPQEALTILERYLSP